MSAVIKYLAPQVIEAAAEAFLDKYHPERSLPIPVEEILDLKLGVNIVPIPGLLNLHNVDSFLALNLNELYIDHDQTEYRYNRVRYSLAHETGHLVLHRAYLESLKIDSVEAWKEIILGRGTAHKYLETQANMFGGFLLMPSQLLEREFEKIKEKLRNQTLFKTTSLPDDKVLAEYAARDIAQIFDVSEEAARYRLLNWLDSKKK